MLLKKGSSKKLTSKNIAKEIKVGKKKISSPIPPKFIANMFLKSSATAPSPSRHFFIFYV